MPQHNNPASHCFKIIIKRRIIILFLNGKIGPVPAAKSSGLLSLSNVLHVSKFALNLLSTHTYSCNCIDNMISLPKILKVLLLSNHFFTNNLKWKTEELSDIFLASKWPTWLIDIFCNKWISSLIFHAGSYNWWSDCWYSTRVEL